jgi:hypothetical protein
MTKRIDVRHEDPGLQAAYERFSDTYAFYERKQGFRKGASHIDWEVLQGTWNHYLKLRNQIEGPK